MLALNVQLDKLSAQVSSQGSTRTQKPKAAESSFSSLVESYSSSLTRDGKVSADFKTNDFKPADSQKDSVKTAAKKSEPCKTEPKRESTKNTQQKKGVSEKDTDSVEKITEEVKPAKSAEDFAEDVEVTVSASGFIPEIEIPDPQNDESITDFSVGETLDVAEQAELSFVSAEADGFSKDDFTLAEVKNTYEEQPVNEILTEDDLAIDEQSLYDFEKEQVLPASEKEVLPKAKVKTEQKTLPQDGETLTLSLEGEEDLLVQDNAEEFGARLEKIKDGSENKTVFSVTDLRSTGQKVEGAKQTSSDASGFNFNQGQNPSSDLTLTLPALNGQAGEVQNSGSTYANFQTLLSSQIENSVPDFVKATNFVLRDGNQGTINMILKPEQLGNVKVSLQLSDKVIVGQITVASKEAMDAFKQNLDTLKNALIQNGFEDASLTLLMSNESAANNSTFAGQGDRTDRQFYSERAYGQYVSDGNADAGLTESGITPVLRADGSRYAIDVVA